MSITRLALFALLCGFVAAQDGSGSGSAADDRAVDLTATGKKGSPKGSHASTDVSHSKGGPKTGSKSGVPGVKKGTKTPKTPKATKSSLTAAFAKAPAQTAAVSVGALAMVVGAVVVIARRHHMRSAYLKLEPDVLPTTVVEDHIPDATESTPLVAI
eukprot:CAMPEP_0182924528 /NCGR_PEP_ID=MMETSP0105_2-20130417/6506_1 /TAXON_ID=81532 ORGANISM="Acanthoeca-like sp., Strain 10tr" /NCGR_SAMPLE_ID=MMETSP0105_2 /ASSEMBLY_ACC=CAM_ASM_000205 /LENGTH=156 /DNA_ID=CAMNT_0025062317 /DNA_START=48 /DNA_END=518 /DNA_ORIENTATION=+